MSALDHPNVIRVIDLVESPGQAILVLEYASGGNLRRRLARGPIPRDEAVAIAADVLAGLAAAHAAGIVHRDVKPENVLLGEKGAKVADFGIARTLGAGATAVTRAGAGTLAYMSPEQVRGAAVDARSDLYSVGVVLHEMLTRKLPTDLDGLDDYQARSRILAGEKSLSKEAAPLREFLEKALATDPNARFQSAAAMRAALLATERVAVE